jgi:hypothetical protein
VGAGAGLLNPKPLSQASTGLNPPWLILPCCWPVDAASWHVQLFSSGSPPSYASPRAIKAVLSQSLALTFLAVDILVAPVSPLCLHTWSCGRRTRSAARRCCLHWAGVQTQAARGRPPCVQAAQCSKGCPAVGRHGSVAGAVCLPSLLFRHTTLCLRLVYSKFEGLGTHSSGAMATSSAAAAEVRRRMAGWTACPCACGAVMMSRKRHSNGLPNLSVCLQCKNSPAFCNGGLHQFQQSAALPACRSQLDQVKADNHDVPVDRERCMYDGASMKF